MGGRKQLQQEQRVSKAKVWGIAEAFTSVLNHVVTTYVMNPIMRALATI
jgi:hypothetical protein